MSTSSLSRQQFGAFCTNFPLGVRTLLEAPGLTTTLTAPKNGSACVYPPLGKRFSSTGSTVGGVLEKSAEAGDLCVSTPGKRAPFTISIKQGRQARHIYLTQRSYDVSREVRADHSHVPAKFSTRCHPTFPRFDSWWFHMILSPQTGFPQPLLQPLCAASSLQSRETTVVKTPTNVSDFPPCCSIAFLLTETLALTEKTQVRSVSQT